MFRSLRLLIKSNYRLYRLMRIPFIASGYFRGRLALKPDDIWENRIRTVLNAPDNDRINRVEDAGKIKGDTQVMHNGIRIFVGSYYGDQNTLLLNKNRGVHEPQEEKAFADVLPHLPKDAAMLELGAFWGFYSMTFAKQVATGTNYLIEPDAHALRSGKLNFRLNGFNGHFFNYFVSDKPAPGTVPTISVDAFLEENKIGHLAILHSDIQGFELKMLEGALRSMQDGAIDYFFISTHTNELHEACKHKLTENGYRILCDANLEETYSVDGLIVAKRNGVPGPETLEISKRG